MKCSECKKEYYNDGILVSCDGDFVCSKECKITYERKREQFFENIQNPEYNFFKE